VDTGWTHPISFCIEWCVWGRVGNTVADEKEVCKGVVEMWRDEFPIDAQDDGDGEQLGRRGCKQGPLRRESEGKIKTTITSIPGMSIHLDEVMSPQNPFDV
jgi:hypothetical protein